MSTIQDLEKRIAKVELRNSQVEANKAWETSWTRRILIAVLTYVVIWCYLVFVVGLPNPFINALVPTIGFLLSTLTLQIAKNYWLEKRK